MRLCYGLDVPHRYGLHPDQCEGCREPEWADLVRPEEEPRDVASGSEDPDETIEG